MDLIAIDITDLPANAVRRGHMVTLLGDGITVDELAHHFGTIGYEVLTSLGRRYARVYKGSNAPVEQPALAQPAAPSAAEPPAPPPLAEQPASPPPLPT
jgi:alanine racemase